MFLIKVDLKLKKRYEIALAELNKVSGLSRYRVVSRIIESTPPLYLAGSIPSEGAFFMQVLQESRRSVYRLIRVAKHASDADFERYGLSLLDAAITYVETVKGSSKKAIDFDELRILVRRDGGKMARPLSEVSVAELRRAISARKGTIKPHVTSPKVKMLLELMKRSGIVPESVTASKAAIVIRIANP